MAFSTGREIPEKGGRKIMNEENGFAQLRADMVADQIARRGLRDQRLLQAMLKVPRHLFVPRAVRAYAYEDHPIPIGYGQTISQPYIVALMTSLLALRGDENVLEVGTGSGYQAAVLAEMAKQVHTVERFEELADSARERLERLGYQNVHVYCGDGSQGWPAAAPYDAIIITAAADEVPTPMLEQLTEGGRMVLPVGDLHGQVLQLWTRTAGRFESQDIIPVSFVPLRGKYGWSQADWDFPDPEK